jgi:hypothetical protein
MPEEIVTRILRLLGYGVYAWEAEEETHTLTVAIPAAGPGAILRVWGLRDLGAGRPQLGRAPGPGPALWDVAQACEAAPVTRVAAQWGLPPARCAAWTGGPLGVGGGRVAAAVGDEEGRGARRGTGHARHLPETRGAPRGGRSNQKIGLLGKSRP